MFIPSHGYAPSFGRTPQFANAYKQIGIETSVTGASPHQLVQMLFDGFMDAISQAKGAMQAGNVELKGRAINRAVRIIDEGLKASLNLNEGGNLAADLNDIYAYTTLRLTQANRNNDIRMLDECVSLIEPLREAWGSIAAQANTAR